MFSTLSPRWIIERFFESVMSKTRKSFIVTTNIVAAIIIMLAGTTIAPEQYLQIVNAHSVMRSNFTSSNTDSNPRGDVKSEPKVKDSKSSANTGGALTSSVGLYATIGAPSVIVKGQTVDVQVAVSPSSNNSPVTLSINTTDGSGQAKFSDGTSTKDIYQTATVSIHGISESNALNDIQLTATSGGLTLNNKNFTVASLDLKEVSFSGNNAYQVYKDDGSGAYTAPQWQDNSSPLDGDVDDPGDHRSPVAYQRNTTMWVAAKWQISPQGSLNGANIMVRGDGPNSIDIPLTLAGVSPDTLTLPATMASAAFPNFIKIYDPLTIQWIASYSVGNDVPVGVSRNQVYGIKTAPVFNLLHTVVHLSCKNADGKASNSQIISAIWSDFIDRDVLRVDGQQLGYYRDYNCTANTTEELIRDGDGRCFAWANLFIDLLKVQGITQKIESIRLEPNDTSNGFLVKYWNFVGPGSSQDPSYPWLNYYPYGNLSSSKSHNLLLSTLEDQLGSPGQAMTNPASLFICHQIVKISKYYYDPSYGRRYLSIGTLDKKAVAGYLIYSDVRVNESDINVDVNGDGDKNDLSVRVMKIIVKKNLHGNILNPSISP